MTANILNLTFPRFSHAAKAFEECDRKYKPVFAEPRRPDQSPKRGDRDMSRNNSGSEYLPGSGSSKNMNTLTSNLSLSTSSVINEGYTKLTVIASPELNQDQLWKLFDIVPGTL